MAVNGVAVFRVRTGGNNVNGGGYDATISGAGADYSQQDAAQASGSAGTAAGTATFTDAVAANFTAAMIGNGLWIASGAGFTAGLYFVVARASSTSITLDRSPGTGSAAVWKIGGAWADPWTNCSASSQKLVAGNTVYVRGAGTMNPAVDDYARAGTVNIAVGTTAGLIRLIGENGRPRVASNGSLFLNLAYNYFEQIYFSSNGTTTNVGMLNAPDNGGTNFAFNCVFDANGTTLEAMVGTGFVGIGNEFRANIDLTQFSSLFFGNNIHNTPGHGISLQGAHLGNFILGNLIAKCTNDGVNVKTTADISEGCAACIVNNTIDGNGGNGISFTSAGQLLGHTVASNLITNHTTGGTYGMDAVAGTIAPNDRIKGWINWNAMYGNTTDVHLFTLNSGTTTANVTGTNPGYAAQSTEGYQIGAALKSAAYPGLFPQALAGKTATTSYVSPGAVQRQAGATGSGAIGVGLGIARAGVIGG